MPIDTFFKPIAGTKAKIASPRKSAKLESVKDGIATWHVTNADGSTKTMRSVWHGKAAKGEKK